ncbi:bifunctional oligoribonuclease/PAP phosphatase NrnA [Polycladomyces subterraneus]|uniref:Bifunctional oligoribonuclease/PAP phosphatase NrnA n=2 Tax=Polycladomyces subterraneus TaxID=1016997 RepID=A0ABT8IPX2_9BACL|nr:bifunctional oligoribonuclease/PAP phosphatase NrnA [Polycladomyces subterraneus]MDN4594452.1 bifunctional oligoribonuclease/PAP phosphatase NrnA [Polycladomyces subterraneus]
MWETNNQLEAATRFVQDADRFLVVSHVNPDGDAIGSTLGVGQILKQLGKRYVMVNESAIPQKYQFLPDCGQIRSPEDLRTEAPFSYVIAVDAADADRMGECRKLFARDVHILNIDHHATNDRFGTVNVVIPDAAATAQVLYDWVEQMGLEWTQELATCIYTGLLTDTGGFRYANTTPRVMNQAAHLIDRKVEAHRIAEEVLETTTLAHLQLLRKALETLRLSKDGQIAWMWIRRRDIEATGAREEDWDGIVNYARNVMGVDVGILFREVNEKTIRVSFRSRRIVDVGALAQTLGGGGHARAAGCTIMGSAGEVERQVLQKVASALRRVVS